VGGSSKEAQQPRQKGKNHSDPVRAHGSETLVWHIEREAVGKGAGKCESHLRGRPFGQEKRKSLPSKAIIDARRKEKSANAQGSEKKARAKMMKGREKKRRTSSQENEENRSDCPVG